MPIKITKYQWLVEAIKSHTSDECLIWPFGASSGGYGQCKVGGTQIAAHRVAFFMAYGHWPFPETRHTCDVTRCINPRHLLEGTSADNHADRIARNHQARGILHHKAKLTEEQVKEIRILAGIVSQAVLAAEFGVNPSLISPIVNRKIWKHI